MTGSGITAPTTGEIEQAETLLYPGAPFTAAQLAEFIRLCQGWVARPSTELAADYDHPVSCQVSDALVAFGVPARRAYGMAWAYAVGHDQPFPRRGTCRHCGAAIAYLDHPTATDLERRLATTRSYRHLGTGRLDCLIGDRLCGELAELPPRCPRCGDVRFIPTETATDLEGGTPCPGCGYRFHLPNGDLT